MLIKFPNLKLTAVLFLFIFSFICINSAYGNGGNIKWAGMGSLFYIASDNVPNGDPAAILPTAGFSAAWQIIGPLWLEGSGDFYFTNYEYNTELGYAMTCNPENRSAYVFSMVTAAQLTGNFTIGKNGTAIRVFGGPAVDLRLAVTAFGLHPNDLIDAENQKDEISKYFWSRGRWFLPVFGTGMDFPLNEHFLLGFDLRVWFPVYRLWTNENIPAIDGWRFGAGLRITPRSRSEASSFRSGASS